MPRLVEEVGEQRAQVIRLAATRPPAERVLVNLSGCGDNDVDFVLARQDG